MKKVFLILCTASCAAFIIGCTESESKTSDEVEVTPKTTYELLGYESEIAFGEHLVTIAGCDDCHTPKMMTDHGPDFNPELRLSGHPADAPAPDVDRAKMESLGQGATNMHLSSWVGPWGISYSANLTPHETGLGNWTKEQFFTAIRDGKYKGMAEGRSLLPPMPWFNYAKMTDDELSAVFAYLQSIKPIDNLVPSPQPPVSPPPTAMN